MLPRGRTHPLVTIVDVISVGVGLVTAWWTFGWITVAFLGVFVLVGLFGVYLLRNAADVPASYRSGIVAGTLSTCALGLLGAGPAGVAWAALWGTTAIPVRTLWRRLRPRKSPDPRRPVHDPWNGRLVVMPSPSSSQRDMEDLDLGTLCSLWQHSYFQLLDAEPERMVVALVDYRQRILDELDHRSPQGLSRWLASAPRASGNPLPYLTAPPALTEGESTDPPAQPENGTA
jgi:hypothetical protein